MNVQQALTVADSLSRYSAVQSVLDATLLKLPKSGLDQWQEQYITSLEQVLQNETTCTAAAQHILDNLQKIHEGVGAERVMRSISSSVQNGDIHTNSTVLLTIAAQIYFKSCIEGYLTPEKWSENQLIKAIKPASTAHHSTSQTITALFSSSIPPIITHYRKHTIHAAQRSSVIVKLIDAALPLALYCALHAQSTLADASSTLLTLQQLNSAVIRNDIFNYQFMIVKLVSIRERESPNRVANPQLLVCQCAWLRVLTAIAAEHLTVEQPLRPADAQLMCHNIEQIMLYNIGLVADYARCRQLSVGLLQLLSQTIDTFSRCSLSTQRHNTGSQRNKSNVFFVGVCMILLHSALLHEKDPVLLSELYKVVQQLLSVMISMQQEVAKRVKQYDGGSGQDVEGQQCEVGEGIAQLEVQINAMIAAIATALYCTSSWHHLMIGHLPSKQQAQLVKKITHNLESNARIIDKVVCKEWIKLVWLAWKNSCLLTSAYDQTIVNFLLPFLPETKQYKFLLSMQQQIIPEQLIDVDSMRMTHGCVSNLAKHCRQQSATASSRHYELMSTLVVLYKILSKQSSSNILMRRRCVFCIKGVIFTLPATALLLAPILLHNLTDTLADIPPTSPPDNSHQSKLVLEVFDLFPWLACYSSGYAVLLRVVQLMMKPSARYRVRVMACLAMVKAWYFSKTGWTRVVQCIQTLPLPATSIQDAPLHVRIGTARALSDIAFVNANKGVLLIGSIQACFNDPHPGVASIGINIVRHLCSINVLDFSKAWRVMARSFTPVPDHGPCAWSWLMLLQVGGDVWARKQQRNGLNEREIEQVAAAFDLLEKMVESDHVETRMPAYAALAHHPINLRALVDAPHSLQHLTSVLRHAMRDLVTCAESGCFGLVEYLGALVQHEYDTRRQYVEQQPASTGDKVVEKAQRYLQFDVRKALLHGDHQLPPLPEASLSMTLYQTTTPSLAPQLPSNQHNPHYTLLLTLLPNLQHAHSSFRRFAFPNRHIPYRHFMRSWVGGDGGERVWFALRDVSNSKQGAQAMSGVAVMLCCGVYATLDEVPSRLKENVCDFLLRLLPSKACAASNVPVIIESLCIMYTHLAPTDTSRRVSILSALVSAVCQEQSKSASFALPRAHHPDSYKQMLLYIAAYHAQRVRSSSELEELVSTTPSAVVLSSDLAVHVVCAARISCAMLSHAATSTDEALRDFARGIIHTATLCEPLLTCATNHAQVQTVLPHLAELDSFFSSADGARGLQLSAAAAGLSEHAQDAHGDHVFASGLPAVHWCAGIVGVAAAVGMHVQQLNGLYSKSNELVGGGVSNVMSLACDGVAACAKRVDNVCDLLRNEAVQESSGQKKGTSNWFQQNSEIVRAGLYHVCMCSSVGEALGGDESSEKIHELVQAMVHRVHQIMVILQENSAHFSELVHQWVCCHVVLPVVYAVAVCVSNMPQELAAGNVLAGTFGQVLDMVASLAGIGGAARTVCAWYRSTAGSEWLCDMVQCPWLLVTSGTDMSASVSTLTLSKSMLTQLLAISKGASTKTVRRSAASTLSLLVLQTEASQQTQRQRSEEARGVSHYPPNGVTIGVCQMIENETQTLHQLLNITQLPAQRQTTHIEHSQKGNTALSDKALSDVATSVKQAFSSAIIISLSLQVILGASHLPAYSLLQSLRRLVSLSVPVVPVYQVLTCPVDHGQGTSLVRAMEYAQALGIHVIFKYAAENDAECQQYAASLFEPSHYKKLCKFAQQAMLTCSIPFVHQQPIGKLDTALRSLVQLLPTTRAHACLTATSASNSQQPAQRAQSEAAGANLPTQAPIKLTAQFECIRQHRHALWTSLLDPSITCALGGSSSSSEHQMLVVQAAVCVLDALLLPIPPQGVEFGDLSTEVNVWDGTGVALTCGYGEARDMRDVACGITAGQDRGTSAGFEVQYVLDDVMKQTKNAPAVVRMARGRTSTARALWHTISKWCESLDEKQTAYIETRVRERVINSIASLGADCGASNATPSELTVEDARGSAVHRLLSYVYMYITIVRATQSVEQYSQHVIRIVCELVSLQLPASVALDVASVLSPLPQPHQQMLATQLVNSNRSDTGSLATHMLSSCLLAVACCEGSMSSIAPLPHTPSGPPREEVARSSAGALSTRVYLCVMEQIDPSWGLQGEGKGARGSGVACLMQRAVWLPNCLQVLCGKSAWKGWVREVLLQAMIEVGRAVGGGGGGAGSVIEQCLMECGGCGMESVGWGMAVEILRDSCQGFGGVKQGDQGV